MENIDPEIKDGKVWLGEDGILRMKSGENADLSHVKKLVGKFVIIARTLEKKPKILIDIGASNSSFNVLWRREIVKIFTDSYKDPGFEKISLWGAKNRIVETVGAFLIGASGLKNIKYFKTEKEALEWLNED